MAAIATKFYYEQAHPRTNSAVIMVLLFYSILSILLVPRASRQVFYFILLSFFTRTSTQCGGAFFPEEGNVVLSLLLVFS